MPPKAIITAYIELLTRGEKISNATLRRKNSRSPLIPAPEVFEQYAKWYRDVKKYFDTLVPEAGYLFYRYELTYVPTKDASLLYYNYTNKQLGEGLEKIRRDVNKIKKSLRESREHVEDVVSVSDTNVHINRAGYTLNFNILTGEVVLNKYRTFMPVGQKKYTALRCIVTGPGQKGIYTKLYEELDLNKYTDKDRRLHDIMREVRTHLKITPKKDAINPDIFVSLPNDGYALK